MKGFDISNYLENSDPKKKTGTCIACKKSVQWARDRLAAHKRTSCPNATEDEKGFFDKRKSTASTSSQHQMSVSGPGDTMTLTEEKRREIDLSIANLYYKCRIPPRIVESEVFKELVRELNPAYGTPTLTTEKLSEMIRDISNE